MTNSMTDQTTKNQEFTQDMKNAFDTARQAATSGHWTWEQAFERMELEYSKSEVKRTGPQVYTLWEDQMSEGKKDSFVPKFTFDARNQAEANSKANGWAMYHHVPLQEVYAKVAEDEELKWQTDNEFVNRF